MLEVAFGWYAQVTYGLPGPFCRANLPKEDTTVTLENEDGKEFNIKYIGYKTGLSAGWRQFCVAHKLLEGDVLVFQLVANCRFKMAIIPSKSGKKKRSRPQSSFFRKKKRKTSMPRSSFQISGQAAEQSENDSEEVGSEVLEGFKLSFPGIQFKDVQNFEDFSIVVEGLVLDSELTEEVQRRYYKLCCSQNAFLHEELIKGLNFKLIAGLISETISIADAIRECSLSTSRDEFAIWDKTLRASELFGMNVGFLRERLRHLVSLAFDSEDAMKTRRYMEARSERLHTGDEISNLEAKLVELKEAYRRSGSDINALKSIAERYEIKFQKHVLAAW
ncbi:B3 domain-containing protein Os01g0234100 [Linum perenne]